MVYCLIGDLKIEVRHTLESSSFFNPTTTAELRLSKPNIPSIAIPLEPNAERIILTHVIKRNAVELLTILEQSMDNLPAHTRIWVETARALFMPPPVVQIVPQA